MQVRRFSGTPADWNLIHNILYNCGSNTLKSNLGFLQKLWYLHPDKIVFDVFDDIAFFFGWKSNKYIRCIAFAVLKYYQQAGIGKEILFFEKAKVIRLGINKITCRTSKVENGLKFWQAMDAKIIGEKDEDWEMQLDF